MHRFFLPFGAYSDTSAPVVATSAPTPKPVKNRIHPNIVAADVVAVIAIPTENQAYANNITLRRPRMSPTVPASSAPISTPTSA